MKSFDRVMNQHLGILRAIGLASVVFGVVGACFMRRWRSFWLGHLLWGVVTLVTWHGLRQDAFAALDRPLASRDSTELHNRAEALLGFSIGLDFGLYPLGGGCLVLVGALREHNWLRQVGYALWGQGPLHLLSSIVWLARLRRLRAGEDVGTTNGVDSPTGYGGFERG